MAAPTLIDPTNLQMPKFEEGDAGIVLKADGTFLVWNTIKDPANPNEREAEQGRVLMAFAAALKLPPIMQVLFQVANDTAIFPEVVNTGVRQ